jgi:hypothetical protein
VFLSYVLSFVYLGIYWNNHHHMLHATERVSGGRDPLRIHPGVDRGRAVRDRRAHLADPRPPDRTDTVIDYTLTGLP